MSDQPQHEPGQPADGDPVADLIKSIRSGALHLAFEKLNAETIRLDGPQSDFMHPLNHLVWAELGRTQTIFYVRVDERIAGTSEITIPNEMLPVLGALVERVTWAERGRVPPPIIDAEQILGSMITALLDQPNEWPEDVRQAMRELVGLRMTDLAQRFRWSRR